MSCKLPVKMAEKIAKEYDLRQVVVIAFDGELQHCVTYGRTTAECEMAAIAGKFWDKILRLDDPARQQKIREILK